ncbi:MAG: hypothetical protein ABW321_33745 [Polyangiales bacterium]
MDERWWGCSLALLLLAASSVLHAQDTTAESSVTAAARAAAIEGVTLAKDGRCPEAIEKLEHAERLRHSPIVLTRLGECYIKVGRLLVGVESLRSVLREPLPDQASEAMTQAYADADTLLEATKPLLASVTITVLDEVAADDLTLRVDGRSLPAALLGAPQPFDPGDHVVEITANGYQPWKRGVHLAQGEQQTLEASLERLPPSAAPAARVAKVAPNVASELLIAAPRATPPEQHVSHWPSLLVWGASAVALGVGAGFGIAALHDKSQLDQRCSGTRVCPEDTRELLNASRTRADVSTIGLAVGAGGAALGLVLFLLEQPSEREAAQTRAVQITADGVRLTF